MTRKNNIDHNTTNSYSFGYQKGVLDYLTYRAQKSFDFINIQISVSWEQPDSLDQWTAFYEGWSNVFTGGIGDIILDEGWCDRKHINKIIKSWKRLGKEKKRICCITMG